jgi:hypothetical protein
MNQQRFDCYKQVKMAGISQISPAYSRQNCLKFTVRVVGG